MQIERVQTHVLKVPPPRHGGHYWIMLELTTDGGTTGLGEAYGIPFSADETARLLRDVGQRHVIGTSPFDIENLWREIYVGSADAHTPHHPDLTTAAIISAFEIACLDIVGKALGQPIYNLLGGKVNDELRTYTYLTQGPDIPDDVDSVFTDPEYAAKRARDCLEMGFPAIKVDPVKPMKPNFPKQIPLDVLKQCEEVLKSIREAVGNECEIILGTHGQMAPSSAIRLAGMVEKYDPFWYEEPVPPENKDAMAKVARATDIPVASGERLATKYEFRELLESGAASIVQMATARAGGILESKKIAGMAESHYAHIAPHLYAGPVELAANIQLDVCSPNFLIQECIDPVDGFHTELLEDPIEWSDGCLIPPTDPGLGIELDDDVLAEHSQTEAVSG